MSLALSSFLIWPPVQSSASMMKSSPGLTVATGGMSGCQRLCCGCGCSVGFFLTSTEMMVFAMFGLLPQLDLEMRAADVVRQLGDVSLADDVAGFKDRESLGDVGDEIQALLNQQNGTDPLGLDALDDMLNLLHDGGLQTLG